MVLLFEVGMLNFRFLIYLLSLVVIFSSIFACDKVLYSEEEIKRIASPDSIVDVVIIRRNGGATTPFSYNICIVPAGKTADASKALMIADHAEDLELFWKQPKFLEIKYKEARIYHFKNFWKSKEVKSFRYVVELRLVPLTDSFSLSQQDLE